MPIAGNLRAAVIEIAEIFDEQPEADWVEISSQELAARIFVTQRTIESLLGKLERIFGVERDAGRVTRYRRPSEKVSEAPPKNIRRLVALSGSRPLSPLNETVIVEKRERERVPVADGFAIEVVLTPELLAFAKEKRGFTEQETRRSIEKMLNHVPPSKISFGRARNWILDERIPWATSWASTRGRDLTVDPLERTNVKVFHVAHCNYCARPHDWECEPYSATSPRQLACPQFCGTLADRSPPGVSAF